MKEYKINPNPKPIRVDKSLLPKLKRNKVPKYYKKKMRELRKGVL